MNRTLKWVLIGLAIAVGVFIIALPIFLLVSRSGMYHMADGWGLRDGLRDGMRMPMRSPFGMLPFFGIFGFIRLLLPAAVLGLAVYGVVALVRGGRVKTSTPPLAACAACGRELVSGGEFCPYCGAKR